MDFGLKPGLKGEVHKTVAPTDTTFHLATGKISVLASPMMIWLMESAAVAAVDHLLPTGFQTVGTHVDVRHTAPTPLGMQVTAHAELTQVEGRNLTFRVTAVDEKEQVGEGTHQRVVIDVARFQERVQSKASSG